MPRTSEGVSWSKDGLKEGLTTAAVVTGSAVIQDKYDVIVIGAGWAGLVAARNITDHSKLNVLLIEARDRIGGRTYTVNEFGEDFEMGGNWILWTQPHIWSELHHYGMHKDLKASSGASDVDETYMKQKNGPTKRVEAFSEAERQSPSFENVVQDFLTMDDRDSRSLMPMLHDPFKEPAPWKNYDHLSTADRLNQLRGTGKYSDDDLEILEILSNGISLTQAGKRSFTEMLSWFALGGHTLPGFAEAIGTYKITGGGMTKLALRILDDFKGDLAMKTVVRKIEQSNDFATVILKDGRNIRANRVVSTIPLNCLRDIEFNPPLSEKRQKAISIGHINKGLKFHFRTPDTHAPDCIDGFSQLISDHSNGEEEFSVAFAYPEADIDVKDPQKVISEYKDMFPADVQPNVTGYLSHDWRNDPFSSGAWCAFGPSYMKDYQQDLQSDHGRIIFASADWADGWRGFVGGAISQGVEAVRKILEQ